MANGGGSLPPYRKAAVICVTPPDECTDHSPWCSPQSTRASFSSPFLCRDPSAGNCRNNYYMRIPFNPGFSMRKSTSAYSAPRNDPSSPVLDSKASVSQPLISNADLPTPPLSLREESTTFQRNANCNSKMFMELMEKDEERFTPNTTCCCGLMHVRRGSSIIATLSFFSTVVNAVLLCCGVSRTSLSVFVEVGALLLDFTVLFALFYGLLYRRPTFLKPFILVNLAWNIALLLLLFLCIAQLIKDSELSENIMWNVVDISGYRPRKANWDTVTVIATTLITAGLVAAIAVNFWFVYVVLLCFQWMSVECEKSAFPPRAATSNFDDAEKSERQGTTPSPQPLRSQNEQLICSDIPKVGAANANAVSESLKEIDLEVSDN